MITMREVKPSNTHTGIDHLLELFYLPAGRSKGAHDLGPPVGSAVFFGDGVKCDT